MFFFKEIKIQYLIKNSSFFLNSFPDKLCARTMILGSIVGKIISQQIRGRWFIPLIEIVRIRLKPGFHRAIVILISTIVGERDYRQVSPKISNQTARWKPTLTSINYYSCKLNVNYISTKAYLVYIRFLYSRQQRIYETSCRLLCLYQASNHMV